MERKVVIAFTLDVGSAKFFMSQTKTWQEIPVEISERVICFTHSLFEDCRYFPSVAEFQISQ